MATHSRAEKKAFLQGFLCALAHNKPMININAVFVAQTLAHKWGLDKELAGDPMMAHDYDQEFIDAGLQMADAQNLDKESLS